MTIEEAIRTLGPDAIRAAAASAIKTAHPDTGGTDEDGARISMVQEARDCLLSFLKTEPARTKTACASCLGAGMVRAGNRFGSIECAACKGKGYHEQD